MVSNVQHSQLCGHCKKEAVTQSCRYCYGAPGYDNEESVKTNYCNAACQKAHWDIHKEACKGFQARKILYRAGDMLQQIFYIYQKRKWAREIHKVKRQKDTLYQYKDYPVENCNTLFIYNPRHSDSSSLTPFPNALFLGDQEKESVLAYLCCHDSILSMHGMVKSVLQGICSKIEEITVSPKNSRFKIILVNTDGIQDLRYFRHELFRVTTNNGEIYAIDLTSSQNGYYEPVVPWNSYERLRVAKMKKVLSFGETQRDELLEHPARKHGLYDKFLSCSRACLDAALQEWQTLNTAFNSLLRLPDPEFAQKRRELYARIGADLERLLPETYERIWNTE